MRTIDPEKTIIAFNLDDLDWTADDWNRTIGTYPYAMKPDVTVYDLVASVTDTPLAWLRGDWFAFTASRPPLYYDLLKLQESASSPARSRPTRTRQRRAYYGPPPGSNLVYDTQSALLRLGYNPGLPDGVYGQRTAEAISEYQYSNRLPVNGQPSPQLLDSHDPPREASVRAPRRGVANLNSNRLADGPRHQLSLQGL